MTQTEIALSAAAGLAFVVGLVIGVLHGRVGLYTLRQALADACRECGKCGGDGMMTTAGGAVLMCSRCLPWRLALNKTRVGRPAADRRDTRKRSA
jgi:hypothetical protein